MGQIVKDRPSGGQLMSNEPFQGCLNKDLSNKLITRSINALCPMGLLLTLTYTTGGTFTTEYNP
jgi:hypothetical protein